MMNFWDQPEMALGLNISCGVPSAIFLLGRFNFWNLFLNLLFFWSTHGIEHVESKSQVFSPAIFDATHLNSQSQYSVSQVKQQSRRPIRPIQETATGFFRVVIPKRSKSRYQMVTSLPGCPPESGTATGPGGPGSARHYLEVHGVLTYARAPRFWIININVEVA